MCSSKTVAYFIPFLIKKLRARSLKILIVSVLFIKNKITLITPYSSFHRLKHLVMLETFILHSYNH